jgi:hypothetical protein
MQWNLEFLSGFGSAVEPWALVSNERFVAACANPQSFIRLREIPRRMGKVLIRLHNRWLKTNATLC